jgi:hypothetical protein
MNADEQLKNNLKKIWAKSRDWEEHPTSEAGIFIVKYPVSSVNQAFIGLKFKKFQNAKKGIFIKSGKEISVFRDLLNCKEIHEFIIQLSMDKELNKRISMLKEWDQIPTSMPGISFTKMPVTDDAYAISAIVINPVDNSGRKLKRKNLLIKNDEDLEKYRMLFNNEKIDRLSRIIDEVNEELSLEFRLAQSKIMGKYK